MSKAPAPTPSPADPAAAITWRVLLDLEESGSSGGGSGRQTTAAATAAAPDKKIFVVGECGGGGDCFFHVVHKLAALNCLLSGPFANANMRSFRKWTADVLTVRADWDALFAAYGVSSRDAPDATIHGWFREHAGGRLRAEDLMQRVQERVRQTGSYQGDHFLAARILRTRFFRRAHLGFIIVQKRAGQVIAHRFTRRSPPSSRTRYLLIWHTETPSARVGEGGHFEALGVASNTHDLDIESQHFPKQTLFAEDDLPAVVRRALLLQRVAADHHTRTNIKDGEHDDKLGDVLDHEDIKQRWKGCHHRRTAACDTLRGWQQEEDGQHNHQQMTGEILRPASNVWEVRWSMTDTRRSAAARWLAGAPAIHIKVSSNRSSDRWHLELFDSALASEEDFHATTTPTERGALKGLPRASLCMLLRHLVDEGHADAQDVVTLLRFGTHRDYNNHDDDRRLRAFYEAIGFGVVKSTNDRRMSARIDDVLRRQQEQQQQQAHRILLDVAKQRLRLVAVEPDDAVTFRVRLGSTHVRKTWPLALLKRCLRQQRARAGRYRLERLRLEQWYLSRSQIARIDSMPLSNSAYEEAVVQRLPDLEDDSATETRVLDAFVALYYLMASDGRRVRQSAAIRQLLRLRPDVFLRRWPGNEELQWYAKQVLKAE